MIGYTMLGTRDMDRAEQFYNTLLADMGCGQLFKSDRFIAWGDDSGQMFCICYPHDGEQATVGNGVMIALSVASAEQVDALHSKALELGGTNEGEPGPRMDTFYCGYIRDLDGNKLNFFTPLKAQ